MNLTLYDLLEYNLLRCLLLYGKLGVCEKLLLFYDHCKGVCFWCYKIIVEITPRLLDNKIGLSVTDSVSR